MQQQEIPILLTVKQFAEKYPAFSEGSLRFTIFHSERNGFGRAFRRIGRKVLIDERDFFACVSEASDRQRSV